MTPEEEQKELPGKPEGQATLRENEVMASNFVQEVSSRPTQPTLQAHRGLGFLFEAGRQKHESRLRIQAYLRDGMREPA